MRSLKDLTEIGRTGKTHGINGELNAVFDGGVPDWPPVDDEGKVIADAKVFVIFEINGIMVPFRIISIRPKGVEAAIIALKGVNDEKEASPLTEHSVYMDDEDMTILFGQEEEDEDDVFYLDNMIGFKAFNHTGEGDMPLGEISAIDDTTANVLFIITSPEGKELLIPANDDFIYMLRPDGRDEVIFDIPGDLININ